MIKLLFKASSHAKIICKKKKNLTFFILKQECGNITKKSESNYKELDMYAIYCNNFALEFEKDL